MKTITYNPETHVLVPREPNSNWCAGCSPTTTPDAETIPLFTLLPPTAEQIEQRVAEAFLKALNGKLAHTFGHDCTDALKANWREYL